MIEVEAIDIICKKLETEKQKLEEKIKKKKEKLGKAKFILKGEKIHNKQDIEELFECDMINSKQRETALDKLERLENGNEKTKEEVVMEWYISILKELRTEKEILLEEKENGESK